MLGVGSCILWPFARRFRIGMVSFHRSGFLWSRCEAVWPRWMVVVRVQPSDKPFIIKSGSTCHQVIMIGDTRRFDRVDAHVEWQIAPSASETTSLEDPPILEHLAEHAQRRRGQATRRDDHHLAKSHERSLPLCDHLHKQRVLPEVAIFSRWFLHKGLDFATSAERIKTSWHAEDKRLHARLWHCRTTAHHHHTAPAFIDELHGST
mmetsp:Transcript_10416/g.26803  ORF Transcript_10416/g.26803 Transcript_10416/m.26803 type:complete len:206 (-) Transcript_10416:161-778(-)